MAFIDETDSAEGRWKKEEWRNFELWEKQENRKRQKEIVLFISAFLLFFVFSSIPVWNEMSEQWKTRRLTRLLADELTQLRKQAALEHMAFRLIFPKADSLEYNVEKAIDCDSPGNIVKTAFLSKSKTYILLRYDLDRGQKFDLPGLTDRYCFDPTLGNDPRLVIDDVPLGFAILPVRDLTEGRLDRSSVLLLDARSANISFN